MRRLSCLVIILILQFVVFTKKAMAVTVTMSNYPSSISANEFTMDVFVDGPNPGVNYLRVDLYKEGTSNYFGETYNGSTWYSGSDGTQYFPITISSQSTASATLRAKVGNPSANDYPGPGTYKLRIRRYTASGNAASSDSQTPPDIQLTVSTPSPQPTQEPTQQPTSTPTPSPTKTPTPLPTATKKPTVKPSPTDKSDDEPDLVLGDTSFDESSLEPSPDELVAGDSVSKPFPLQAVGLILSGIGFMGYGAFSVYKKSRKDLEVKTD